MNKEVNMVSLKNLLRAVVRPTVTLSMVGLIWYVAIKMLQTLEAVVSGGLIEGSQVLLLIVMVVEFILATGATIFAFYFGTRTRERSEDVAEEESSRR